MVAFAMAANAQFVIGGQLGFTAAGGNTHHEAVAPVTTAFDVPGTKAMNFTIAPSIGYVLNDNMQIGLSLQYTSNSTTTYNATVYPTYESWNQDKQSMFGIAPYFRYYFLEAGDFNFFCQAELGYVVTPKSHYHYYNNEPAPFGYDNQGDGLVSTNILSFAIVPGVNYKFSDFISADCFIDLAGLAFLQTSTKNYNNDGVLLNTTSTHGFGLIADATAKDLNTHYGNFRIGINFHF